MMNAFDYMYLNPELSAYMNVLTVEQAQTYYSLNSNANLANNISIIPSNFNSEVFLTSSRDIANISSLSRDIFLAMSNMKLNAMQISRKQKYVANIYQQAIYNGSNNFTLTGSNTLGSNNMIVGDSIRVIDPSSTELYFTVIDTAGSMFTVSNSFNILYPSSNYLVYGIKVTDYDRIAQINYARIIGGYSNITSNYQIVSAVTTSNTNYINNITDSNFNATLYRILYPDARALSDTQTYLDWVNKRKNETYRIINVDDISAGNGNKYVNFNFLNISSNMIFRDSLVNGISTYMDPTLSNRAGDSNKLITESAMKQYTESRLSSLQNTGSFNNVVINDAIVVSSYGTFSNSLSVLGSVFVNSNSVFSNNVRIAGSAYIDSNLEVSRQSIFRNSMLLDGGNANATFCNCVLVNGSMSVAGNIYNARIGLGYMGSFLTSNNGSNIIQAQNYNDNSDMRIKKNILPISAEECLKMICKLEIATFSYCYGNPNTDNELTTGVIAQQLENAGLREYVYYTTGFLPDIMINGMIDGNYLYVQTNLVIGNEVKVIFEDSESTFRIIKKIETNVYVVAPSFTSTRQECLVYGYKTNDIRNVDYKQLFVLSLGAIKDLYDKYVKLSTHVFE